MSVPWTNTNIQVKEGQILIITATGRGVWKNVAQSNPNARPKPYEECGPDGTPPEDPQDYYSNIQQYQCRTAYKGALIGKVGVYGLPFPVGSSFKQKIDQSGVLYLGINDMKPEVDNTAWADNSGSFTAHFLLEDEIENPKEITVDAQRMWTDTGIRLQKGDKVTIEASGQVNSIANQDDAAFKWVGPDGWGYDPASNWTIGGRPAQWIWVLGRGSSFMCLTGKVGAKGSLSK